MDRKPRLFFRLGGLPNFQSWTSEDVNTRVGRSESVIGTEVPEKSRTLWPLPVLA